MDVVQPAEDEPTEEPRRPVLASYLVRITVRRAANSIFAAMPTLKDLNATITDAIQADYGHKATARSERLDK